MERRIFGFARDLHRSDQRRAPDHARLLQQPVRAPLSQREHVPDRVERLRQCRQPSLPAGIRPQHLGRFGNDRISPERFDHGQVDHGVPQGHRPASTRESDHSPASIVQTKSEWTQDQFSQELQLLGNAFDNKLNWVLGGYYADESGNHEDYVTSTVDAVFLSGAVLKGKSTAFFAQASYDLVENLSLTGGIRWTEDKKTFGNDNQYVIEAGFLTGAPFNPDGSGLANGDPLMGPLGSTATQKDTAWTPMASLVLPLVAGNPDLPVLFEGLQGGWLHATRVLAVREHPVVQAVEKEHDLRIRFQDRSRRPSSPPERCAVLERL